MMKRIAFLCVNPWEQFLPPVFQGRIKECYRWTCSQMSLQKEKIYCLENSKNYGEAKSNENANWFMNGERKIQLLYVESQQKEVIKEVFSMADLVFVGLSACRRECDKLFMAVLPWKEQTVFLWDDRICEKKFLHQIEREYQLKDFQILERKKLPSYLTEALFDS